MKNLAMVCLLFASQLVSAEVYVHGRDSDECGNVDDGLARIQELAKWSPSVLKGDQANWYYNSTARIEAALLKSKLASAALNAEEKAAIEQKIKRNCESLD